MIILSHYQADVLLQARREGRRETPVSLDLNRTESGLALDPEGIVFSDGQRLSWASVEEIADTETTCFLLRNGELTKTQFYSDALERFYSLYPTRRAPTMLLSGIPMHRIKTIDPHEDTLRKMRTISPVAGHVLDICTGLGYTATEAARTAAHVTTIELDSTVLDVCRCNPWSQTLFDNPKITQKIGDAAEIVETLSAESFSRIFHDPPTFSIAGDLYSGAFYRHLYRLLKRSGRLFHYIGDLDSTSGRVVAKGVVKRLQEAGFGRVERKPEAFGLTAEKG
jgi:predicted methyltransferase